MTPEEIQALVAAATCLQCKIPPGQVQRVVLAVLIDLLNGDTPPTDPDELLAETACLCVIPDGMVPYAIIQVLTDLGT